MNDTNIRHVLTSPKGEFIQHSICCIFRATKNEAKYEALIAGLSLVKELGIRKLDVCSNSQQVVN